MAIPDLDLAEQLFFEGLAHFNAGDLAGSENCLRQALSLNPDFAEAASNLALTLQSMSRGAEAEVLYTRALALDPASLATHRNFATLLLDGKRFAEAEMHARAAVDLSPQGAAVWSALGVVLACAKREDEAEACYRHAMALDPEYATARFNLAYILLRQGRMEEGWECLDARDWYARLSAHFTCPRWQGESLRGKSMLIGIEAGHGDMIHLIRYADVLKGMGASRVSVLCHPALESLLQTASGVDEVLSLSGEVPREGWDYWCPPLSLPRYCGTRQDTIPARLPYLHASPQKRLQWRDEIPAAGLRVGLCWQGNPAFENDADRSLADLTLLAPLWSVPGVSFISLQKHAAAAPLSVVGQPLFDAGPRIADFSDTAAVIAQLDLVISVDTAVAHLAGALGKPCWIMLPEYKTDWRWFTARDDSPWYPDVVRLFRQREIGAWGPVVESLRQALMIEASARASRT